MKALIVSGTGLAVGFIVLFSPFGQAPASEVETRTYLVVVERICTTGVTPEVKVAHAQLMAALAKEGQAIDTAGGTVAPARRRQIIRTVQSNPHGWTTTNFWGGRPPAHAYAECVQAP